MVSSSSELRTHALDKGHLAPPPTPGKAWRILNGALRVSGDHDVHTPPLLCLALKGDLIGIDCLLGRADLPQAYALVPTLLAEIEVPPCARASMVEEAYLRLRQRCQDMVTLRTGAVPERVRFLLLLLADHQATQGNEVPSLRDMAQIVGSTVETVSRVLGGFQDRALLQDRKARSATLNVRDLRQFNRVPGMTSSSLIFKQRSLTA